MKLYTGSFSQIGSRAYQVRDIVFVKEQNVPVEHEHDDKDEISEHFLIEHNGEAVATARVQPDGHIGRCCCKALARQRSGTWSFKCHHSHLQRQRYGASVFKCPGACS